MKKRIGFKQSILCGWAGATTNLDIFINDGIQKVDKQLILWVVTLKNIFDESFHTALHE